MLHPRVMLAQNDDPIEHFTCWYSGLLSNTYLPIQFAILLLITMLIISILWVVDQEWLVHVVL